MVGLAQPLETSFENKQELYNNFSVLILCYCLLMFTDFIDDAELRYNIGYAMVLLIIQNILVSLYFISLQPARQLCLRCKRCKIQNAHSKKYGIKSPSLVQQIRIKCTKDYFIQIFKDLKRNLFEEEDSAMSPENSVKEQINTKSRKPTILTAVKEDIVLEDLEDKIMLGDQYDGDEMDDAIVNIEDLKKRERKIIKSIYAVYAMFPNLEKSKRKLLMEKSL
jgi:hypothetical protein